jgi:predicted AAA+ superfamily ATPase
MPHTRQRYLHKRLSHALAYSPIVGILGQRQVGKTTLLEQVSAQYTTLDRAVVLGEAEANAENFVRDRPVPFGIDEAQLCPALFPALKEHVRQHKRPGQFVLTGSVRFTSKSSIRESLTGRIANQELLPFTIAESAGKSLPNVIERILKARKATDLAALAVQAGTSRAFDNYLQTGGLPGICFYRDAQVRQEKFAAHLDTLLNRDIRQVYPTTLLYGALRALMVHIAHRQGRTFEVAEAARVSQISRVSIPRVLFALEALFLIRVVPALGAGKPTIYLEDQGMATWLMNSPPRSADDLVRGIYANLRQELHYRPELAGRISHWLTRDGSEVPLVFESAHGQVGILATLLEEPTAKVLGSVRAFQAHYPKARMVIAHSGKQIHWRSPLQFWIPYWMLC